MYTCLKYLEKKSKSLCTLYMVGVLYCIYMLSVGWTKKKHTDPSIYTNNVNGEIPLYWLQLLIEKSFPACPFNKSWLNIQILSNRDSHTLIKIWTIPGVVVTMLVDGHSLLKLHQAARTSITIRSSTSPKNSCPATPGSGEALQAAGFFHPLGHSPQQNGSGRGPLSQHVAASSATQGPDRVPKNIQDGPPGSDTSSGGSSPTTHTTHSPVKSKARESPQKPLQDRSMEVSAAQTPRDGASTSSTDSIAAVPTQGQPVSDIKEKN